MLGVINHPRPSSASQIWTVILISLSWNIVPSYDAYKGRTSPINPLSVTRELSSEVTMPRLRHPFDTRPVHCSLRHCLITFPLLRLRDFSRFLLTASPSPSRMFWKLLGTASQSQVTRRKQLPYGHYLPSQTGYQECSESFLSPDFSVNQSSLLLKEEQTSAPMCLSLLLKTGIFFGGQIFWQKLCNFFPVLSLRNGDSEAQRIYG